MSYFPRPDTCHLLRLGAERLRTLVRHVAQFVAIRQFPPSGKSLPPPAKSRWWIPAAARVLALVSKSLSITTYIKFNMKIYP